MHFFIDYQATIYIAKSGAIVMKQHILVIELNFYWTRIWIKFSGYDSNLTLWSIYYLMNFLITIIIKVSFRVKKSSFF